MAKALDRDIAAALGAASARERLEAILEIPTYGRRGGPALRRRQTRIRNALTRMKHDRLVREQRGPNSPRKTTREDYHRRSRASREHARQARIAAEQRRERQRRDRQVLELFRRVIADRGGETDIVGQYGTADLDVQDIDPERTMCLLHAEGWRQYSRAFGARWASLTYLCGIDDSGPWAVRVPGSMGSVREAEDWLEPAEVQRARQAGRTVLRQGDVYVIQMQRDRAAASAATLPEHHRWDESTRTLHHGEHAPLKVAWAAKLVPQSALAMGRSGRRACGD